MLRLTELGLLLSTICKNVSHIETKGFDFPRIVYTETGFSQTAFDNAPDYGYYQVAIDLYTVTDFEPLFKTLLKLLADNDIAYEVEGIEHGTLENDGKAYNGVTWYRVVCGVM